MKKKIPQIKNIELAEVEVRGKVKALNACTEKEERSYINGLSFYLKKLRREEKIKPNKV